jgi:hypothetical protein
MIELLIINKETYINRCVDFVKSNHPDRTTEHDKCYRDLSYIYDAIVLDLKNNTTDDIQNIGAMFWHAGKLQLQHPDVELKVYDYLLSIICADIPAIEQQLSELINILKLIIQNGFGFKHGNTCDLELVSKMHNLAQHRHNWKPLIGNKPSAEHMDLILKAASAMTPALSNEYNYRVDEVPDHLKEELFKSVINYSNAAAESGNPTYATDKNEQLMAPTVLCYSLRYNQHNDNLEQFCGDMTVRDPNILNIGICVWNTVLTAEALGYKTSFCQMTTWKRDNAKKILGLHTDEVQSEFLTNRNGECTFMPMFFLAIGTEGRVNINSRSHKSKDIINKLKFND